jgi:hypothetical protein
MIRGDISNKQAPFVMFDIDSLLFQEKPKTIWTKVSDVFKSDADKYLERPVNQKFLDTLHYVWHKHNVCIGLVSFDFPFYAINELEEILQKNFVPYTNLFFYNEWEDLRNFGLSIYTFSANEELISYISRKEAMHINRIREVL